MPKLILFRKAEVVAEYFLGRKNTIAIGSARLNDVVINEKNVSEHHATIIKTAGSSYTIKDNNTITGTKVNDRTIAEKELQFGDVITIGSSTFQYLPDRRMGKKEGEGEVPALARYSLIGVYGQYYGKRYDLHPGDTNIGREKLSPKGIENDIVLDGDMTVSKGHAKITCQDGQNSVKDIGSTGGVAVNGNKVGQLNSVVIKPNDEIAIGRTIFRFVESGKLNYGTPKHHRIFILKMREPLTLLLTIILIIGGLFALVTGTKTALALTGKPSKLVFDISRDWTAAGNALRSTPSEYDTCGAPAIADLNRDGINDIVFLSPAGLLYAWDGKEGGQIWSPTEIPNPGKCSPAVADMNGDNVPDIVVTADGAVLIIIDGATGGIIRKEVLGGALSDLSPCVFDLDGDGRQDVVACSEEGMVHFVYAAGYASGMQKFTEFVEGPIQASPVLIATKKLSPLIAVCSYNSKIFFLDGKNRSKKTVDLVEKTGKVHLMAAAPGVGDLNGDGIPEIVVQSNVPQYVSSIDIMGFNVNWTYFVEPIPPSGLKHHSSPLIADMNGDGLGDVLVASANGNLYVLKGKTGYPTGELLWKIEVPEMKRTIATPALYDFDRNGIRDVVVGSEDGSILFIKNSPKRKGMEIMSALKVSNGPITSSVAIGDVNADGLVDVVTVNTINTVQVVHTNVKTVKNSLLWPVFLGNNMRSGSPAFVEHPQPYYLMALAGLLVMAGVVVFRIMIAGKKAARRPRIFYI